MFEGYTYDELMKRMLERVHREVDKSEGEILWTALAPASAELAWAYICLDELLREAFGDTASRDFLLRRARERGLSPTAASPAVLLGEFTPEPVDVLGQRFSLGVHNYLVTKILSPGRYEVTCEAAGAEGGRQLGALVPIDYIRGLETARLVEVLVPGEDEEETEHFRRRYLDSFGVQAFGGNRKDYRDKVAGIAGVGDCRPVPVWDGGGTVKLILVDSDYHRASDTLIDRVQGIMDPTGDAGGWGLAPIGHVVTTVSAQERVVDVSAIVTLEVGVQWHTVAEQATAAVETHFHSLRTAWADQEYLVVRVSQVENAFLGVPGVVDIQLTALNGREENLVLSPEEIPVLGGMDIAGA